MFDADTVATRTLNREVPTPVVAMIEVLDLAIIQMLLLASVYDQSPVNDMEDELEKAVVYPCRLVTPATLSK